MTDKPAVLNPGSNVNELASTALELLETWFSASEDHFYTFPAGPGLGYYGSGYNGWGVQTNQKYCSALAALADNSRNPDIAKRAGERALASLRFSLQSHHEGAHHCSDGDHWGHTWISVLGLERMMNGLPGLRRHFTPQDEDLLRRVLQSEADWLTQYYHRGKLLGVHGNLWAREGGNDPESNIWNGAFLWRVASFYPDAPQVEAWRERALEFLATGISLEEDLQSETLWDGKPLRERCRGANFFPNFSLDHHGYFNVGYMAICLSNVAILHFDARLEKLATPELLHLHADGLWGLLKRLVMPDGRLARIGGDSRVRYAYCQEYLLPTLLYAADKWRDPHALGLLRGQLDNMRQEQQSNPDGSFYGTRLSWLREEDPVYYTRVESDRANVLGMLVTYAGLLDAPEPRDDFAASVSGSWSEPRHGEIMHRSPDRLAAFSWNAFENGQGTALPGDDGNLLEWDYNLSGRVLFPKEPPMKSHREVDTWWMESCDGGFLTQGAFFEGLEVAMAEQWKKEKMCRHQLTFCALPDGHTVVGMEFAQTAPYPCWVKRAGGLHFNLPNDLFNGYQRTIQGSIQNWVLTPENRSPQLQCLPSPRLLVESRIGLTGIYGGDGFRLLHPTERSGARFHSIFADVLFYGGRGDRFLAEPNAVVIDCGWSVETSARRIPRGWFFQKPQPRALPWDAADGRALEITGWDGITYRIIANFSSQTLTPPASILPKNATVLAGSRDGTLPAGQAVLIRL